MATKTWVGTDTGNEGDWSVAANWSPSGVPEAADDVYLENSSQGVTAGLDQSAIALASFNKAQTFTGAIGTSSAYLQISATAFNLGYHNGPGFPAGSSMVKLDIGATAATVTIDNSGTPATSTVPAILLKANNASTNIRIRKGSVGIAFYTGETTTVGIIDVGYKNSVNSDVDLFIGSGVTMTTLDQTGGEIVQACGATTVSSSAGTLITTGSGAITTLNAKGGTVTSNSTGTITNLNITGGIADFLKSAAARTVTTLKLEAGGKLKYNPDDLTITNKVDSDYPVILTATAA